MHPVTRLLIIMIAVMIGAAITAFSPFLKIPVTTDGYFTIRDVVEEIIFPVAFAAAHLQMYLYFVETKPDSSDSSRGSNLNLAGFLLVGGIVVATLGVGVRFVGDTLTTSYCTPPLDHVPWCARAQFFHKEVGHAGVFLGSIVAAASLLICQLKSPEVRALNRRNLALLMTLGALGGIGTFAIVVEGQVAAASLPIVLAYALASVVACRVRRLELTRLPLLPYQTMAACLALVAIVAWGAYWGGFPSFMMIRDGSVLK